MSALLLLALSTAAPLTLSTSAARQLEECFCRGVHGERGSTAVPLCVCLIARCRASQANRRYLYFASKAGRPVLRDHPTSYAYSAAPRHATACHADIEGHSDVARVFRDTADGEGDHPLTALRCSLSLADRSIRLIQAKQATPMVISSTWKMWVIPSLTLRLATRSTT